MRRHTEVADLVSEQRLRHGAPAWRRIPGGSIDAQPSGRPVSSPHSFQIRDGKVRRQRGIADNLNALRQLGVVPMPRS